jgi:hypothetical protein
MPLKFKKTWISDEGFESAGVFDVDNDGVLDIVSGAFWYKGPDFRQKLPVGEVKKYGEYYDDFSTIAIDVNGDGCLDVITGGWWGGELRCWLNPGKDGGAWTETCIAKTSNIETTRAWDVDGDGILEIVPNTPGAPLIVYKLITDANGVPTGRFDAHQIFAEQQGHGLGCGDIAGNGRMDFIMRHGWLEAPADPYTQDWIYHPFDFGFWDGSVPMLVVDLNGDGRSEVIIGRAHSYGLDWWQRNDDNTWTRHPIDPFNAQYHDLHWADIDGDGQPELVTGKRHRAHCGNEAGEWDDMGIYYFKWTGENFAKQVIDYQRIETGTAGVGIHFALADLRNTGRLDLIAPGKGGLYVYYNEGME